MCNSNRCANVVKNVVQTPSLYNSLWSCSCFQKKKPLIHHNNIITTLIIPASLRTAILFPLAAIRVSRVALADKDDPMLLKCSFCDENTS
jgi:hypothetical protein